MLAHDEDLDAEAAVYAIRLEHAGDAERERLRDDLVRRCLPFAGRLTRRYQGRGEPNEDLEQVARLGLVKAVNRYEPGRGSFTAYAVCTIQGEIKKHFRDKTWAVHVARRVQDLGSEVRHARAVLVPVLRRDPTAGEIARHLDIPVVDVLEALRSASGYWSTSLNAPAGDEPGVEVGDLLGAPDPDLESLADRVTVDALMRRLPEREQRMILLRFYGNQTQAEIAAELGISQMHVSRLLTRTLAQLRDGLTAEA